MSKLHLLCGDSLQWMRDQPNGFVDLIVADPPYNLGKEYGNTSDKRALDDMHEFTEQWVKEAIRILKPAGTIYTFMGFRNIAKLYAALESEGLTFLNWICWHYTQGIGKTKGFSPRHDDILVFSKGKEATFNLDAVRVPQKYYRKINNMRGANPGDVWEFSHIHYCQENRQNHPTQKPEGLIERIVRASSNPGELVLDPFSGSGTTLRVCQQLGRDCIGLDVNPAYMEMAKGRLAQPFLGFDSIDPRMKRVPFDLRDKDIRDEYLKNHITWFLDKHENDVEDFLKEADRLYGDGGAKQRKKRAPNDAPSLSVTPLFGAADAA